MVEDHAGAAAARGVVVLDRIGEPSGPPHDGHGAVAQAVHLVEAARLVAGRHEEHVARRLDPVRELVVVTAVVTHPTAEATLEIGEELLVPRLPAPEHRERPGP